MEEQQISKVRGDTAIDWSWVAPGLGWLMVVVGVAWGAAILNHANESRVRQLIGGEMLNSIFDMLAILTLLMVPGALLVLRGRRR